MQDWQGRNPQIDWHKSINVLLKKPKYDNDVSGLGLNETHTVIQGGVC